MMNSVAGKLVYALKKCLMLYMNFKVNLKKVSRKVRNRIIDMYRSVLLFLSDILYVFRFLYTGFDKGFHKFQVPRIFFCKFDTHPAFPVRPGQFDAPSHNTIKETARFVRHENLNAYCLTDRELLVAFNE